MFLESTFWAQHLPGDSKLGSILIGLWACPNSAGASKSPPWGSKDADRKHTLWHILKSPIVGYFKSMFLSWLRILRTWFLCILCPFFFSFPSIKNCNEAKATEFYPWFCCCMSLYCYWKGVWDLAAHCSKANKQPGWWKGKFALFQMPTTQGEGQASFQKPTPPSWQPVGQKVL